MFAAQPRGIPVPTPSGGAAVSAYPAAAAPSLGAPPGTFGAKPSAQVINLGGVLRMGNAQAALEMGREAVTSAFEQQQARPVIQGLAGHIRSFWMEAYQARRTVETEMIEALLARRGQYTSEKMAKLTEQRQPAIYMMVASAKMRQIESLLRDVLLGTGSEKCWTLRPTPVPDLPPSVVAQAVQQLQAEIEASVVQGIVPTMEQAQMRLRQMRDELMPRIREEAAKRCERMEQKMEDQLAEGGWLLALDQFIADMATFKTAFIAGPIVRKRPCLAWGPDDQLIVEEKLQVHFERVDPFTVYPAKWAQNITKDPFIRRHQLARADLNEMIGVEGFSEDSIRKVLELFDDRGLREWLSIDGEKARAEGKEETDLHGTGLIDALQYFGSASGRMLREWGIDAAEVPDLDKEYQIEAWMVGHYVIKAVLNADPLARRPIYGASFQMVPGSVWGNAPYDLMSDCQDMCNAAARALAANLGISSGPQVAVLSNRIPAGEDVTEMYPWKIWQFESDPMGSTAAPISFFQPQSNAAELMTVYERFSALADEYTGIPRYMAGFETAGAGRTASGMSMMIGNAGKVIKQVLGTADVYVLSQAIDRLHYHNMRFGDDPELRGDVRVVARGAMSMALKEAAQVRTNEFLQATANPIDMQILGLDGRAELLRHAVKRLDMNTDKVVPPAAVLAQRQAVQQAQMQMMAMQGGPAASGAGQQASSKPRGQELSNGAPVTDHYEPQ